MKFIFWFGLTIEIIALLWYFYQVWIVFSGRSTYVESYYPDLYRQSLIPAAMLSLIAGGAILARFYFKEPKIATYIVYSPLAILVLAGVVMVVSSMFIKDWR